MRVAALTARDVEDPRAGGQPENIDQASDLAAVACEVEDRAVLEQVVGVEVSGPPIVGNGTFSRSQKKTGSRYAPNTASIAARISYSVQ